MKKIKVTIVMACMVCMVIPVAAQNSFGVRGGLNLSTFGSDNIRHRLSPGLHFGFYTVLGADNFISIQPEVLYSKKGSVTRNSIVPEFQNPNNGAMYRKVSNKLSYIDVPVFLRLNFDNLHILAGPQISYLMRSKYKYSNGESDDASYSSTSRNHTWDFGLAGGLGFDFTGGINLGARVQYGLRDVYSGELSLGDNKQRNLVFQATVGYTFGH